MMILVAALAATGLGGSAHAGGITEIVAFGDSLSDVGNTYLAIGFPPSPPYYPGVYSNGPNWIQLLAGKLGVATPTASLAGGTDYAWGGAESGAGLSFMGTPNLGLQVDTFLGSNTPNASQLFTVWAGANDFLNGGQTDPTVVVANIAGAISALAGAGGTHFLVPNLPLLGELPATNGLPQPMRDALDGLTLAFNGLLQAEVANLSQTLGVSITYLDVNGEFGKIIADPAAFGLTNVTDADPRSIGEAADGQAHLFWDTVHPTTVVHEVIAQAAFNAVVPEPSSFALLAIAGAGLSVHLGVGASRRRKAA
ncbi:MAG: SGNH/GDSL hydrolase family protein [Paludisphaera borealis]|uniref:SGNH/GDSL hydrolase family protein n=1 Tax=Paludisphaera borealis TaxID=1387353 RepID=UPI00283FAA90|nr:SGNH/GDSL hydrolase family protein [Paludisphaera borealis]MDR3620741.1 SGNH/GDSL hydrolase family protein [Paludisphaera borealis]